MSDDYTTKRTLFQDKMEKHNFTPEQMRQSDIQTHIKIKQAYGLEYLDFYEDNKKNYCCRYISDPSSFNYDAALNNIELTFLLNALVVQQGKVFFEDYKCYCV